MESLNAFTFNPAPPMPESLYSPTGMPVLSSPSYASMLAGTNTYGSDAQAGSIRPAFEAADPRADVADAPIRSSGQQDDAESGSDADGERTRAPGKIAPFVSKLWDVLNDDSVSHIISWDGEDSFVVAQAEPFLREVLPRVCRSISMCAFVRQLNGYGFSKSDPRRAAFRHLDGLFLRGRPDLLPTIERRRTLKRRNASPDPAGGTRAGSTGRTRPRTVSRGRAAAPVTGPREPPAPAPAAAAPPQPGATMQDFMAAAAALAADNKKIVRAPRSRPTAAAAALAPALPTAVADAAMPPRVHAPPPAVSGAESAGDPAARYREMYLAAVNTMREIVVSAADPSAWRDGTATALIDMAVSNFLRSQEREVTAPLLPPTAPNRSAALDAGLRSLSAVVACGPPATAAGMGGPQLPLRFHGSGPQDRGLGSSEDAFALGAHTPSERDTHDRSSEGGTMGDNSTETSSVSVYAGGGRAADMVSTSPFLFQPHLPPGAGSLPNQHADPLQELLAAQPSWPRDPSVDQLAASMLLAEAEDAVRSPAPPRQ